MKRKRALLLLNPRSRSGGSDSSAAAIRQLEASGLVLERVQGEDPSDITRQVSRRAKDVDLVIVGGGDGTVNAALRGLIKTGCVFR